MPLVLHGGTGIPGRDGQEGHHPGRFQGEREHRVPAGLRRRRPASTSRRARISEGKGFDPRKLLAPGCEAIKATVKEKMELFGSVGKA